MFIIEEMKYWKIFTFLFLGSEEYYLPFPSAMKPVLSHVYEQDGEMNVFYLILPVGILDF